MEYTVTNLSNHTIQELKFMLMELGGQPKTKNKQEIIEEIIKIHNGEIIPTAKTKRGRPSNMSRYVQSDFEGSGFVRVCDHKTSFDFGDKIGGVFDVSGDGYGVVHVVNCCYSSSDAYVSKKVIKKFALKKGDYIQGTVKTNVDGEFSELVDVGTINGVSAKDFKRNDFENFIAKYPDKPISLSGSGNISLRVIDLFAPIGRGQRGVIYGPKNSGKLQLLKNIAFEICASHSDIHVIVLLIGERSEEINDFKKGLNAEVVYSTFDQSPQRQVGISELCLARAKRLAETGKDVVLLVDSITKFTRAYNLLCSEKVDGSSWVDSSAVTCAKKFMASAVSAEGASLTIISTAEVGENLVDSAIFDEISSGCNMELSLNKKEKFQSESINVLRSGTLKDDLLLTEKHVAFSHKVRNMIADESLSEKQLYHLFEKTSDNDEVVEKFKQLS